MSMPPASSCSSSRVLIGDDLDDHAIEIRQRRAGGIFHEVARVPGQHHALSRQVVADRERTEPGDLGDRGAEVPRRPERAGVERRFEPVPGQNRQVVEQPQAGRERLGKGDHDRERVGGGDGQRLARRRQRVGQHRGGALVVERPEGEDHVVCGEGMAVGEHDARLSAGSCSAAHRRTGSSFRRATARPPG